MEKVEQRNYGYGVTSSRSAELGNEQFALYRFSQKTDSDGVLRHQKTAVATFEAPIAEEADRDVSTIMPGLSAAGARVVLGDFLSQNPDSKAIRQDGMDRLHREAAAEIEAAREEAYIIEAKRMEVAIAVAGLSLHTADEMAAIEANQLAAEQTLSVEG
jgi:hypothetical protein